MKKRMFDNLRAKWQNQSDQYREWELGLTSASIRLKNALSEKLGVEDLVWENHDDGQTHQYVQFSNLETSKPVGHHPPTEPITDDGELPFGISVTLDRDIKTFPKQGYSIPVVLKYIEKEVHYNLWDSINQTADSQSDWTKDENEMVERIIKLLDLHFSFDPRDGAPQKTGIGFINN